MRWKIAAAWAGVLVLTAETVAANPTAEVFGQLPFLSGATLSPDGRYFAAIQPVDGRPAAVIYQVNAAADTRPSVYGSSDWIVTGVEWLKNDRLLVVTRTSHKVPNQLIMQHFYRGMTVGPSDEKPAVLFNDNPSADWNFSAVSVVDKNLSDPDWIYMPLWTQEESARLKNDVNALITGGGRFRNSLYRVNVHTGKSVMTEQGSYSPSEWIMDGSGSVVARVDETGSPLTDHVKVNDGGTWNEISTVDARGDNGAGVAGISLDGKSLVTFRHRPGATDVLVSLDIATGKDGELYANDRYDVESTLHDEWTGRVIGASYVAEKPEYIYFDPAREAVQKGIEAVFSGLDAHAVSTTKNGLHMIVKVEGPQQPPAYYFLDRKTHQATQIASEYVGLSASDLGVMRAYPYKARDGLDIPAYITLPPGRTATSLPVVVMPHGGPDARDMISFDWWAQFLANRGYLVFQPNYRGSSGYGRTFTEAGLQQWGLKMQDDITDGVKKLIADGIADPKRICIVGGSYGGYAALAGAVFTPDLYACAASFAGVTDLESMLTWDTAARGRKSSTMSFWSSRIGDRSADSARLAATSPALHADQVKIPILLMHGVNDTTVPIEQSEEMRDALKRAGKDVTYVAFESDDHYFALEATRVGMLKQLEAFLAKNIGN